MIDTLFYLLKCSLLIAAMIVILSLVFGFVFFMVSNVIHYWRHIR